MNNRATIDRELLIPILIGGLSVIGITVVLIIGRSLSTPAPVAMTPSSTSFKYIYLGTEPAITTLTVEGSELPLTEELITEEPITEVPILPTATRPAASTPIILTQPNTTRTATGTPARSPTATRTSTASAANTYDDTDSRLTYTGSWINQTDVNGVYQSTLHISDVADNKSVTIQFSGQEIFFYYLSGPSGGIVTIYLDNDPLALTTVNQARDGGVWHYILENTQTHVLRIEHTGGGSVNVDRFVILVPTPTPTKTPTP